MSIDSSLMAHRQLTFKNVNYSELIKEQVIMTAIMFTNQPRHTGSGTESYKGKRQRWQFATSELYLASRDHAMQARLMGCIARTGTKQDHVDRLKLCLFVT
jgi:hypothetical protein